MVKVRAAAAGVMTLLGVLVAPGVASASHDTLPCADVTVLFARGSGQPLGAGEATRFFASTGAQIGAASRVNAYEVGAQPHGGAIYPAAGVGTDSTQAFANLIGADVSWTGLGRYNASVAAGIAETTAYLRDRAARCPVEVFVAGGYSQGAHVVGSALSGLVPAVRNRVRYVALFGDPKLSLPEGRGFYPPACRGSSLSPYRRGNVGCFTDNGILEARVPYVPSDLLGRVGSWCDRNDPICTNDLADFARSTHGNYDLPGNGIDAAATEAARVLAGQPAAAATVPQLTSSRDPQTTVPAPAAPAPAVPAPPASAPAAPAPAVHHDERREVALAIDEFWAAPGDPVTFQVAAAGVAPVEQYRWDLNADGRVDKVTHSPALTHTYARPFEGTARVVVRYADGQRAAATARLHINRRGLRLQEPRTPVRVRTDIVHTDIARSDADSRDVLIHLPPAAVTGVQAWRIHDRAGQLVAIATGHRRTLTLRDVPHDATLALLTGSNQYGTTSLIALDLPATKPRPGDGD